MPDDSPESAPAHVRNPPCDVIDGPSSRHGDRLACDPLVVGDLRDDSTGVPCARGTADLGTHRGFVRGEPVSVRLCRVRGFPSTSPESVPGSTFYVPGARGDVIVNARVSAVVLALVKAARDSGLDLSATSSFRTARHQRGLCRSDPACLDGEYTYVAPPGWSNHQLGVAIDFAGTDVRGGRSCVRNRAIDRRSRVWRFLEHRARRFGFQQYAAESWHWDAAMGHSRC